MIFDGRHALAMVCLSVTAIGCDVGPRTVRPPVDTLAAATDAPEPDAAIIARDSALTPDTMDSSAAVDVTTPGDAGAPSDAPLDAPRWPANVTRPSFARGIWGPIPTGGPAMRPFRLPVGVERVPFTNGRSLVAPSVNRPRVAVDALGNTWLTKATVGRVRRYDGRESTALLTLLDAEGRVVATHDADGSAAVLWIEADVGGALVLVRASGRVRVGDATWTTDAAFEPALLRFDARGARRWWVRLAGAEVLRGFRVVDDRVAVVLSVAREARVGDRVITGPRLARVDFDGRGDVTDLRLLGTPTGEAWRALPLADGGAMTFERGDVTATVSAYAATGALRWRQTNPARDAAFDERGGAWVLGRWDLLGVDEDGHERWRSPAESFEWLVRDDTLLNQGRELRPLFGTVGVISNHYSYPTERYDPPRRSYGVFYIDLFTRDGVELTGTRLGALEAHDLAAVPGRVCVVSGAPNDPSLGDLDATHGAISCDGLAPAASCTVDGYCGPCLADLLHDDANCGACGRGCDGLDGTLGRCLQGVCVYDRCDGTHADCDADPRTGCEVALTRDASNCGACGNTCPAGSTCERGRCTGAGVP